MCVTRVDIDSPADVQCDRLKRTCEDSEPQESVQRHLLPCSRLARSDPVTERRRAVDERRSAHQRLFITSRANLFPLQSTCSKRPPQKTIPTNSGSIDVFLGRYTSRCASGSSPRRRRRTAERCSVISPLGKFRRTALGQFVSRGRRAL